MPPLQLVRLWDSCRAIIIAGDAEQAVQTPAVACFWMTFGYGRLSGCLCVLCVSALSFSCPWFYFGPSVNTPTYGKFRYRSA